MLTQYASPTLIDAIVYEGAEVADDPAWATSGAPDRASYARWAGHLCGLTCLQMVLAHRDGAAPALLDLLGPARQFGAYTEDPHGRIHGLIYAPFAAMVRQVHGLHAEVHPQLAMVQLEDSLAAGHLVVASVHKEIRRPHLPPPGRGGHLVLVTGQDTQTGRVEFHNPSGHTAMTRAAALPAKVFAAFFAHRGIAVHLDRERASAPTRTTPATAIGGMDGPRFRPAP